MNAFEKLCEHFKFNPEELKSHDRHKELVDKRQKIAKLLRVMGLSYPQIGSMMNRDHSSIMHLCKDRKIGN